MVSEHYLKTELYEKVSASPELFDWLQEGSLDGVWYWDLENPENEWLSPRFKQLFGYKDDEIPNTSEWWQSNIFPEDLPGVLETFDRHVKEGAPYDQIVRYRHKDGSTVWVRCRGLAIKNEAGEPVRMLGAHTDVTALKLAEEGLREAQDEIEATIEQRTAELREREVELQEARGELESLLSASPAVIYRDEAAGEHRVKYISSNVTDQLGYKPSEFTENPSFWVEHIHPEDRDQVLAGLPSLFETGHLTHEYRFLHKDGTHRWMHDDVKLKCDADGQPVEIVGSWIDVTETKKLELQYAQAQKMELVGQIVGGVAHDFNNLLMVVSGYAETALTSGDLDEPLRGDLEEIHRAGERASRLTRQLLAFSRQQVLEPRPLDLTALITGFETLLRRTMGEDIELTTDLQPDLGSVRADPGQLEQVLLNLAFNARDAMPGGGHLTIETANVELDQDYAGSHVTVVPGPHVMLAVSDSGHGMDKETSGRVFEPFFTTKERGTGLGLASVYGIVKQSGGYIWCYSEPGHGTTFKIYLPRVEEKAEPAVLMAAQDEIQGGPETILVVEDETSVLELVVRILESQGYQVLTAERPDEALQVAAKHEGDIDLLLTDVIMPGGTGTDLAEQLVSARPEMKVLFVSGYADRAVLRNGVLAKGTPYLAKPFSPRDLAFKVREILDRE